MRQTFVLSLAFVYALAVADAARAQTIADDYPQRPVTFICPFPPGGGTDILTRMLAQELQDKLKKPFVVDNRPGAGTIVAAQAAARAAPDGYTIFLAPVTTLGIGPNIRKALPYDTVKDFAPIGLVGSSQFALVANPNIGAPTLQDLIALIRSKPGQLSYATSGASTPTICPWMPALIGGKAIHVLSRSVAALTDDLRRSVHGRGPRRCHPPIQEAVAWRHLRQAPQCRIFPTIVAAGLPAMRQRCSAVAGGTPPDRRQAQWGADGIHQPARDAGQDERSRHHADHQHARRARAIDPGRDQEMGAGGEGRGDRAGVRRDPVGWVEFFTRPNSSRVRSPSWVSRDSPRRRA
jgi:hypothetical protein